MLRLAEAVAGWDEKHGEKWRCAGMPLCRAIYRRPVTPEVAGSSPVARALGFSCKAAASRPLVLSTRRRPTPLRRHYVGSGVEAGADRLLGIARQVAVVLVDRLHRSPHHARQLEDRDTGREGLGCEGVAQLVGAAPRAARPRRAPGTIHASSGPAGTFSGSRSGNFPGSGFGRGSLLGTGSWRLGSP
jgi:hypothetical protein